jgi:hypothetical protein
MLIVTKYDYCQACHLLLSECRCNTTLQAETVIGKAQTEPIWVSTWMLNVAGNTVVVNNVIVKGTDLNKMKLNETYLKRATRTIRHKSTVINIKLEKQIGLGVKE